MADGDSTPRMMYTRLWAGRFNEVEDEARRRLEIERRADEAWPEADVDGALDEAEKIDLSGNSADSSGTLDDAFVLASAAFLRATFSGRRDLARIALVLLKKTEVKAKEEAAEESWIWRWFGGSGSGGSKEGGVDNGDTTQAKGQAKVGREAERAKELMGVIMVMSGVCAFATGSRFSGLLSLRNGYKAFGALEEGSAWRNVGIGFFTGMLACLPPFLRRSFSLVGFSVSKEVGLSMLEDAAEDDDGNVQEDEPRRRWGMLLLVVLRLSVAALGRAQREDDWEMHLQRALELVDIESRAIDEVIEMVNGAGSSWSGGGGAVVGWVRVALLRFQGRLNGAAAAFDKTVAALDLSETQMEGYFRLKLEQGRISVLTGRYDSALVTLKPVYERLCCRVSSQDGGVAGEGGGKDNGEKFGARSMLSMVIACGHAGTGNIDEAIAAFDKVGVVAEKGGQMDEGLSKRARHMRGRMEVLRRMVGIDGDEPLARLCVYELMFVVGSLRTLRGEAGGSQDPDLVASDDGSDESGQVIHERRAAEVTDDLTRVVAACEEALEHTDSDEARVVLIESLATAQLLLGVVVAAAVRSEGDSIKEARDLFSACLETTRRIEGYWTNAAGSNMVEASIIPEWLDKHHAANAIVERATLERRNGSDGDGASDAWQALTALMGTGNAGGCPKEFAFSKGTFWRAKMLLKVRKDEGYGIGVGGGGVGGNEEQPILVADVRVQGASTVNEDAIGKSYTGYVIELVPCSGSSREDDNEQVPDGSEAMPSEDGRTATGLRWTVTKRFSELKAMHDAVERAPQINAIARAALPTFPSKLVGIFGGGGTDPKVVARRVKDLDAYLKVLFGMRVDGRPGGLEAGPAEQGGPLRMMYELDVVQATMNCSEGRALLHMLSIEEDQDGDEGRKVDNELEHNGNEDD